LDHQSISVSPIALQKLSLKAGCYSLIIFLKRKSNLRVGKLGVGAFPKGIYIYTGSALNGLGARLSRHVRRRKNRHWHIDYLLAVPEARIVKIICYAPVRGQECRQNQLIAARPGASVVLKRFGASDCKAGCGSHLYFFKGRDVKHSSRVRPRSGVDSCRCPGAKKIPPTSQQI
jgi:Uri superfamily endonuclease